VQDCAIDACRHTQQSLLRPSKQRKQSCICCKPRCGVHACPAMSSLSPYSAYAFITLQRPSQPSCIGEVHQDVETGKDRLRAPATIVTFKSCVRGWQWCG